MTLGNPTLGALNGALNAGLRIVGSAAAIYNLATANTKIKFVDITADGANVPQV